MRPPSPRLPRRLALVVALLAGALTAAAVLRPEVLGESISPFFWPAAVGFMLVGGVHGDAPGPVIVVACSLANAAAWGFVAYVASRLLVRLAGRATTTP